MIRVSLSTLVCIYLFLFVGTVFAAWMISNWRRKVRENQQLRHWLRCSLCGMDFEDTEPESATLPKCPRCGSFNERTRPSRL